MPSRLDRSAWGSRSGAEQGQIISAFKFLGFLDGDGSTQQALRKYVETKENSDDERRLMGDLLKGRYGRVFESIDLQTATPKQVIDAIGNYGTTGATKDRAVRFFLKAAEYAKLPLSPRLTSGMRTRSSSSISNTEESGGANSSRQRKQRRTKPENDNEVDRGEVYENATGSAVKTIQLRAAVGTLTLSGTFNPFDLDGEDRKLVYDIIDLMKQYERAAKSADEVVAG